MGKFMAVLSLVAGLAIFTLGITKPALAGEGVVDSVLDGKVAPLGAAAGATAAALTVSGFAGKEAINAEATSKAAPVGVTEGRIVRFVAEDGVSHAAVIVKAWNKDAGGNGNGLVNLQVFLDGSNDREFYDKQRGVMETKFTRDECDRGSAWRTSISFSSEPQPRTWHFPPRA
jgi:hypothetical protein